MAPSRRRGAGKAAVAAAARRQWKVGELVLAKVKGFPAWPATVSEPEKWGYSSDGKKVLVYFFGTQQIAFCNPADVQAFTEEKKQSLLNKRHGKGADFLRALKEITESFEKQKKQEEGADCSANGVAAENVGVSEPLQDDSNAPETTLDTHIKSGADSDREEADLHSEDASVAEQMLALRDNNVAKEQPSNHTTVRDATKLTTYSSRKRHGGARSQLHALPRKESCLSRMELSSLTSMSCDDGGLDYTEADDGALTRRKRIRRPSGAAEIHDVNSGLKSNGSDEDDASEVATVESDNTVLNECNFADSDSKLERSDAGIDYMEGGAELNKGFDFQIKAVLVKKKRKPTRKRGNNSIAECPAKADVEADIETEMHNLSQNPICEHLNERASKENGDEHLPLVKRARVRMSRTCYTDEEANICLSAEEKCCKEATVNALGNSSLLSENISDSCSKDESFPAKESLLSSPKACVRFSVDTADGISSLGAKSLDGLSPSKSQTESLENKGKIQGILDGDSPLGGRLSGALSPQKSHAQILETKAEIQKVVDDQSNYSFVVEADLSEVPLPKSMHDGAVEASSADSAEDVQSCAKASPITNTSIAESCLPQKGCSIGIKSEKCSELNPESVSESKEPIKCSACEESQKDGCSEKFMVPPVVCPKEKDLEQSHVNELSPEQRSKRGAERAELMKRPNSPYDIDLIERPKSSCGVKLRERPRSPCDVELMARPKNPDKVVNNSKNLLFTQDPVSFNAIDISPRGASPKRNISHADCKNAGLLNHQTSDNGPLSIMPEAMEDIIKEQANNTNSISFSDYPSCEKMSISSADLVESPVRGSPHSNSVCHISTAESANIVQNNGCYSPNAHLHCKKASADVSFEGGRFHEALPEGSKAVGLASNFAEAECALSSFEEMLGSLARTKESIGRATRSAIDCAKYGVCAKAMETLARNLESEPSLHRRVDFFFLVDSIAQCSRGLKGDAGGAYISAIQAQLPRLLSATAPQGDVAQENRRQCLKVLRLWLERRILPESVIRQHVKELEAQSSSISAGPYSRRSARTERPFDDPVRDMEGMLVDEYGSNSSLQLAGFCMPSVLKEEDVGSDSDGENFEAVTPEHYSVTPEKQNTTPAALERHTHILEAVDGELEMEDVAPCSEAGTNSYDVVTQDNISQSLNNQFVPPPDLPSLSVPLPPSPHPPLVPPPPPQPGPCGMSDSYPNGIDCRMHAGQREDHLGPSIAPRMNPGMHTSATHYQGPDCRYLHAPNQTSEPAYGNTNVHPPNHMPQMDGPNFQHRPYPPCPQPPPPLNQFCYMPGPPHMKSRRDGYHSYSQRSHYMPNYDDRNFHHNHERMRPAPYDSRDGWRFPPPSYGPRYHDKARSSYGSGSYDGPPRDPPRYHHHRWSHPSRPSNHRSSFHYKPRPEDSVPVGMRGTGGGGGGASSMWHQR